MAVRSFLRQSGREGRTRCAWRADVMPDPWRQGGASGMARLGGRSIHHELAFDSSQVGDGDRHMQRAVPVDMQMELDAAETAFGVMRPDIGDIDIGLAQFRAARRRIEGIARSAPIRRR